jgi:hypothetical protein
MKITLIILASSAGLFIIIQIYLTMASSGTQSQPYKLISTEKNFEIRFYPAATVATISSSAKTYKELGNSGFRKLAGYIFGGNKENTKIAMTAPVHMDINDSASSMSFVMPKGYTKENLPKPNEPDVTIRETPDEYVAAIKFSGFASDESIQLNTEILEAALKEKSISYYGHFRFLGYNPPFQLLGRRNEIIVNINWSSK